jgi:hypothetical protein
MQILHGFHVGQGEHLAGEVVDAGGLVLDAIEGGDHGGRAGLASELERDVEAGERGTELVRDVAEESSLGFGEGFELVGHVVEVVG